MFTVYVEVDSESVEGIFTVLFKTLQKITPGAKKYTT
jgi:hypothetical protein